MKLGIMEPLRFPSELEKGYTRYYYQESLLLIRVSLMLGVLLYVVYGVLDLIMLTETMRLAWIIRFGMVVPATLVAFGLTFTRHFLRFGQAILMMAGIILGWGIIVMIGFTQPGEPGRDFYFVGITLVLFWLYAFSRMRFVYATTAALLVTVGYLVVEIGVHHRFSQGLFSAQGAVFMNNILLFASCNMIGVFVSFGLEKFLRNVYRQQTIIHDKQRHLNRILDKISDSSDTLLDTSSDLSATADQLNQGSVGQAENVSEVVTALTSMERSISGNTSIARETSQLARSTAEKSRTGQVAVSETLKAMKEISRFTGKIEEISNRTNILALNAAIEAARVGEQGKQFAVVATEIRKLADVSRESANEIKKLADSSVKVSKQSEAIFKEIVPHIEKTTTLIENITRESTTHLSEINTVNRDMNTINSITRTNVNLSTEIATAAKDLNEQARGLKQVMVSVSDKKTKAPQLISDRMSP